MLYMLDTNICSYIIRGYITKEKLIEKDILDKKDKYYFQDPLFEYWLRKEIV